VPKGLLINKLTIREVIAIGLVQRKTLRMILRGNFCMSSRSMSRLRSSFMIAGSLGAMIF